MTDEETVALADRFFTAVERGDLATVRMVYADDAGVWHNNDQLDQPVEENLLVLGWMAANLTDLRYTEVRREVVSGGFVQQHVLRAETAWGAELELPAMMRVHCADGRITRLEEYFDSAQLAVLRRPR